MIMIWNRKELFMGYSLQKFSEIRHTLSVNGIKYTYRLVDIHNGSTRGSFGTFGENLDYSITYYIYVHKRDYGIACKALRNQ
ncbi:MAG: hypothetical protein AB6733_09000 [Clostridiaceae bacterium]